MVFTSHLIALAALAAADLAPSVSLRCEGIGTFPGAEQSHAVVQQNGQFASGTVTTPTRRSEAHVVYVELSPDGGRVRLPKVMVPVVNSGSNEGWWSLYDLHAAEREVSGRFRINPFNKPLVRLDRTTGDIAIEGAFQLSYRGVCAPQSNDRLF